MMKSPSMPTLEIAETDEIAALLAELMPAGESKRPAARPPAPAPVATVVDDSWPELDLEVAPPAPLTVPVATPPVDPVPTAEMRHETNGHVEPAPPAVGLPYDGPFTAPIGVLALGDFFDLINWGNQPEEAQPLPLLGILPPPPGHEWTVASVLSQFAWD